MADIRCPNCGKENPASLKNCQYCQAPLPPESRIGIGDKPTKKNTGELEPVLPDWLRDVRQQARDSAEEEAAKADTLPKIQKVEPPDLLAGLASQSTNADDEDVPDWLAGLSPKPAKKPSTPDPQSKSGSDFFAQFEQASAKPQKPAEPPPHVPAFISEPPAASGPERDELSDWFAKASEEPAEPFALESDSSQPDLSWDFKEGGSLLPKQTSAGQPKEEEDLSWLRNLEAEAKKTGELSKPKQSDEWYSNLEVPGQPGSSSQEDLSWLNDLGSIPASSASQQKPAEPGEDLSWLDDLGSLPASEQPKQEPSKPAEDLSWLNAFTEPAKSTQPASTPPAPKEDLAWLNDLGGLPVNDESAQEPSQPKEEPGWLSALGGVAAASQKEPAQEDMSWLDELGGTSQPSSEEDLSWLRDLQGLPGESPSASSDESPALPPDSLLSPRKTAPLGMGEPEIPDWLKSATQEPSMPLGTQALDRMREDDQKTPASQDDVLSKALFGAAMLQGKDEPAPPRAEPPPAETGIPASTEAASLFNEASSLFSDDLPEWLSSAQPADSQAVEDIGIHAEGGEALSPADLPSWVQAMRPVEAVVAGAAIGAAAADQPIEREGPLAGLKGVIPIAAIGSLRRPRPIPLTLQTSEDQQASAAVLEQILLSETTPRDVAAAPSVSSQRTLRWVISGLILFVLIAVLATGTQIMPVSPVLPPDAGNVNNVVMNVADNAPVLVILDYEPSLAGEMEAVSGPVLDQLVQLHHPYLSFIATSPSGNALVERLLKSSRINEAGYINGQNYTNLGYLPGGESGALAFLQSPQTTIPASPVLSFSEYAAVFLLTDHSESARTWVEQFDAMKQTDPTMASIPLVAVSSAQTGPMLQPYTASRQISGMLSGLPNAVRYEFLNGNRPGTARMYWDAFGVGMMLAVFLIVIGSLWSVYAGIRARRAESTEE